MMSEQSVSLSLWLPCSRANFYSFTENAWLELETPSGEGVDDSTRESACWSKRLRVNKYRTENAKDFDENKPYVPLMLVGVLRRLLEVMPTSFGYAPTGTCLTRGDSTTRARPVTLTMTLELTSDTATAGARAFAANRALRKEGVSRVELRVDENGHYAFTAYYRDVAGADPGPATPSNVHAALRTHIVEVFGGAFVVHPMAGSDRSWNPGNAALKLYNGLRVNDAGEEVIKGPPQGALTFAQLNVLAEGLWNDLLAPAVYLEQPFVATFLAGPERKEYLHTLQEVIGALTTDADASGTAGQIAVLHRFLSISGSSSLLRLKLALDSVRRRLLDEMMGTLHRQHRLVQLNLSENDRERRPELAVGASEAQLRGYTTLIAAKLPLILGVRELTRLAHEHLQWVVCKSPEAQTRPATDTAELANQLSRLDGQLKHWNMLLDDLESNVESLDSSITHAWQDRLLYEQQQVRSQQGAMAEIDRGRQNRPTSQRPGRAAYNFFQLVLAAAAIVVTVTNGNLTEITRPGAGWLRIIVILWPVWAAGAIAYLILPLAMAGIRVFREQRAVQLSYPYEFAFHLDEPLLPANVRDYANNPRRRKVALERKRRLHLIPARKIQLISRGYGRIERISPDTTLAKVHVAISLPVGWLRYARFEMINEIQVHKIASRVHHVLVQCRVFGESTKPLTNATLIGLLTVLVTDVHTSMALQPERFTIENILERTLYDRVEAEETRPTEKETDTG
jgi:hypothetical protein